MYRLVPAILNWRGFRVTEIPVDHRERKHGKSKYALIRVQGLLDLISLLFLHYFDGRPFHFFGAIGIIAFLIGGAGLLFELLRSLIHAERTVQGLWFHLVILNLSGFVGIIGLLLIAVGFISELVIQNTYWEQSDQMLHESVKVINQVADRE